MVINTNQYSSKPFKFRFVLDKPVISASAAPPVEGTTLVTLTCGIQTGDGGTLVTDEYEWYKGGLLQVGEVSSEYKVGTPTGTGAYSYLIDSDDSSTVYGLPSDDGIGMAVNGQPILYVLFFPAPSKSRHCLPLLISVRTLALRNQ